MQWPLLRGACFLPRSWAIGKWTVTFLRRRGLIFCVTISTYCSSVPPKPEHNFEGIYFRIAGTNSLVLVAGYSCSEGPTHILPMSAYFFFPVPCFTSQDGHNPFCDGYDASGLCFYYVGTLNVFFLSLNDGNEYYWSWSCLPSWNVWKYGFAEGILLVSCKHCLWFRGCKLEAFGSMWRSLT